MVTERMIRVHPWLNQFSPVSTFQPRSVMTQRNRMVIFRLSQDEYSRLKSDCEAAGGRNLSDYTRTSLLTSSDNSLGSLLQQRFSEIDRKLTEIQQLIQRASGQKGSQTPGE
jgi:uncharacterized protein YpiB (UPF0302 family)